MSKNLLVRVSSSVLFSPIRAATNACTLGSSCSCRALKSSSDLAKAKASFPVRKLVFIGGITLRVSSALANFGFDISSAFSMPHSIRSFSFWSWSVSRWSSSLPMSNVNTGSMNIRIVKSITLSSGFGNARLLMNILNNL